MNNIQLLCLLGIVFLTTVVHLAQFEASFQ
jgi:hypothetical protein